MNKYDFLIDKINDILLTSDSDITSKISYISNEMTNWEEIIESDNENLLNGVLKANGGTLYTAIDKDNEPISGFYSQVQNAYIEIAIKQVDADSLKKTIGLIQASLLTINRKPFTLSSDYEESGAQISIDYLNMQSAGQFKINGNTYNVMSFWFDIKTISGCILSSSVLINFQYKLKTDNTYTTATLYGVTDKYTSVKAVTDSYNQQGNDFQQTLTNSYLKSASISYVRKNNDDLHKALARYWLYDFKLSYYDGEVYIFSNEKVLITDNTENALNGGVITHSISLIGGAA